MKDIIIWIIVIVVLPLAATISFSKGDQSLSEEFIKARILWQLQFIRQMTTTIAVLLLAILVVLAIQFTVD